MNGTDRKKAARLAIRSPRALLAASRIKKRRLTYLPTGALLDLALAVVDIEKRKTPGVIIEAGTALGGSAILMAITKRKQRQMDCHDMFGMIPPPSDADGADVHERYAKIASGKSPGLGGDEYYGYHEDLQGEVEQSFADYGVPIGENSVRLVQGLFQDTIEGDEVVALAHLDGDWYESTKVCLDRIGPRIVPGGRMVIDDYDDWSGCRTAVDEFLLTDLGRTFTTERHTRLHLVRA